MRIRNHRVLYDVEDKRKIVWILALRKRGERTYK
jgi:mRNA-degrading endonuclease RelE of RelBE toxin-antitoxin system